MKALSKDPEQRFATIQEFANALEAASAPAPEHAEHTLVSATSRRAAPVRLRALLVTVALLILAAGGLTYPLLASHFLTPPAPPSKEQILYQQATSGTPSIVDALRTNSPLLWLNAHGSCRFTGGALHVSNSSVSSACGPSYVSVSDFASQIQVTMIKGDEAGFMFRSVYNLANSPGYDFTITSSGQCGLFLANLRELTNLGASQSLLNLRPCAAIRTGQNQMNLLTVIARKSDIYLYINKQYIAQVVDTSAASGHLLVSGVNKQGPVDVAFSDLQIWNL
jgi:hypothetical protein